MANFASRSPQSDNKKIMFNHIQFQHKYLLNEKSILFILKKPISRKADKYVSNVKQLYYTLV